MRISCSNDPLYFIFGRSRTHSEPGLSNYNQLIMTRASSGCIHILELELVYLPKNNYCIYPRMVCRLAIVIHHPHFGWPKMNFDRISRHFRSIRNFDFFFDFFTKWLPAAILDDRKSLVYRISRHFRSIQNLYFFLHKMAASGHFGWPKFTFDRISRHLISIHNFDFFFKFTKWLPPAILDDRKLLSNAFLAISEQYTTFVAAIFEVRFGPFWMTENHFRSHFSPFQINTQLFFDFFFQNGRKRPFWKSDLRQKQ